MAANDEVLKISGGKKGPSEWSVKIVSTKTATGQFKQCAVLKGVRGKDSYTSASCLKSNVKFSAGTGKVLPTQFGTFVVQTKSKEPVPAKVSAVTKGMKEAQKQIKTLVKEFADILFQQYKITEIELTLAFSAKGAFLGIGVGGEASIKVKISPIER
jgi:hypothetical protein